MKTIEITHKRCSLCQLEKPASAFQKQARAKDGLQSRCRSCRGVATDAPVYKQGLALPPFDAEVWADEFARRHSCTWCKEQASCLLLDGAPYITCDDVQSIAGTLDPWCGECSPKENLRSRMLRKNRADQLPTKILETNAFHDARLAARRSEGIARSLGDGKVLKDSALNVSIDCFLRRESHKPGYFELVERTPILTAQQRKEIRMFEIVNTDLVMQIVGESVEDDEQDE